MDRKATHPFSLSTRRTTTISCRPTRISLLIDRIRRRIQSEGAVITRIVRELRRLEAGPIFAPNLLASEEQRSKARRVESCLRCCYTQEETRMHPSRQCFSPDAPDDSRLSTRKCRQRGIRRTPGQSRGPRPPGTFARTCGMSGVPLRPCDQN